MRSNDVVQPRYRWAVQKWRYVVEGGAIRVGEVGSELVLVHDQNQLAIAIAVDDLSHGYCSDGAGGSVSACVAQGEVAHQSMPPRARPIHRPGVLSISILGTHWVPSVGGPTGLPDDVAVEEQTILCR